jgi:hypothetical protein
MAFTHTLSHTHTEIHILPLCSTHSGSLSLESTHSVTLHALTPYPLAAPRAEPYSPGHSPAHRGPRAAGRLTSGSSRRRGEQRMTRSGPWTVLRQNLRQPDSEKHARGPPRQSQPDSEKGLPGRVSGFRPVCPCARVYGVLQPVLGLVAAWHQVRRQIQVRRLGASGCCRSAAGPLRDNGNIVVLQDDCKDSFYD